MDRQLSPEEIQDLLAAYAIDAVDDDERREIDEYLAGDPDTAEVSGLQHEPRRISPTPVAHRRRASGSAWRP